MSMDEKPEEEDIPEWLKRIRSLHEADELDTQSMETGSIEEGAGTLTPEEQPGETYDHPVFIGAERETGEFPAPRDVDAVEGAPAVIAESLDEVQPDTEGSTEKDHDQTRSSLPGWLEGLRPVEDAAISPPAEPETPAQKSGPLAGMSGLLYAEEQLVSQLKPPALLPKLRLSPAQRAHVDLLINMLEGEGEPLLDVRPAQLNKYSEKITFWVISLLMLGVIIWPLATTGLPTPAQALPVESQEAYRLVEGLSPGDPVLVVFDYDPGFSGELEVGAAPVLEHLVLKGATIVLVSTSPTGPVLAERFITQYLVEHQLVRDQQYVNLGFIPGGATGLASFSHDPQGTLPMTLDGVSVGSAEGQAALIPLQSIQRLSDYRMVLVITDQALTARTWVEQVQPKLEGENGQTPLLMVVSAQAEPLVKPFYEANPRQVQGLVAGLMGGAAYGDTIGRSQLQPATWDAFGLASLVAALTILTGGLVAITAKSLRRTDQP